MEAEARLVELGLTLPALPQPGGNYLPVRRVGNLLYLAGVISTVAGSVIQGTVGLDRSIDEGYQAARACALTQLAVNSTRTRLTGSGLGHSEREWIREFGCRLPGFS